MLQVQISINLVVLNLLFVTGLHICSREVRKMVDQYKKLDYPLHVLINNAAIQAPKGHRGEHTKDGIEVTICTSPRSSIVTYTPLHSVMRSASSMELWFPCQLSRPTAAVQITFASNYYGPLYLTELLLPIMKKTPPAGGITKRIVWVTSIGSQLANPPVLKTDLIPWNDLK